MVIPKYGSGSVLILSVIFLIILSITGLAVIYQLGSEELLVRSDLKYTRCVYLAEAGIERGRQWLRHLNNFPEHFGYVSPFFPYSNSTNSLGSGGYWVMVYRDAGHILNQDNARQYYVIESSGIVGSMVKALSETIVVSSGTFSFCFHSASEYPVQGN